MVLIKKKNAQKYFKWLSDQELDDEDKKSKQSSIYCLYLQFVQSNCKELKSDVVHPINGLYFEIISTNHH